MKNKQRKEWKRSGKKSLHHMVPSSRNGESVQSNLLHLDSRRHEALHLLFGNLTWEEIIQLLTRVKEIKDRQKIYLKYLT